MIWPASLVSQSRSQMSSATPISTIMSAAPSRARIGPGFENTRASGGSCDPTANAATMPMNIAIPPSRGVGRVCTSRSRIFG